MDSWSSCGLVGTYDIHGNVKELVQDHPVLTDDGRSTNCSTCEDHRFKHLAYRYDLISGNVKQVDYQKGKPDAFHHRYTVSLRPSTSCASLLHC